VVFKAFRKSEGFGAFFTLVGFLSVVGVHVVLVMGQSEEFSATDRAIVPPFFSLVGLD
jgi:hypothetical protein